MREPKDPAVMSAAEINRELDKLDALRSAMVEEFIDAGRGSERASDTQKLTDPLALREKALWRRVSDLQVEIHRRYGPNAPSRLPSGRGYGPIKPVFGEYGWHINADAASQTIEAGELLTFDEGLDYAVELLVDMYGRTSRSSSGGLIRRIVLKPYRMAGWGGSADHFIAMQFSGGMIDTLRHRRYAAHNELGATYPRDDDDFQVGHIFDALYTANEAALGFIMGKDSYASRARFVIQLNEEARFALNVWLDNMRERGLLV